MYINLYCFVSVTSSLINMNGSDKKMQALVEKVQKGDSNAFGEIYDLLLDKIYRFVFFKVSDKQEAEDLTEQVFLKAWKNIMSYKNTGAKFETWLFRIARNTVIDYYRTKKQKITINDEIMQTIPDGKKSPEEVLDNKLLTENIIDKIKLLSENYREIISLKFIEEKENQEISEILGKSEENVRVLQSRALKALKALVYEK